MPKPKEGEIDGKRIHYSVGALIERRGKYLMIDRATPPLGLAGPAGHVDEGENEMVALFREIEEEVGLKITKATILFEEFVPWNWCNKGVTGHYWRLYRCSVTGKTKRSHRETKSAGWYTREEIAKHELEPAWKYWFEKLDKEAKE